MTSNATMSDQARRAALRALAGGGPGWRMAPDPSSVDPETFVGAFRRHPAGVTVITFDGAQGPVGFTATSVASVSLRPPLLSFAISTSSSCWPALKVARTCVVNLLAADQHATARRFAARGVNRFDPPVEWSRLTSGEPVLSGTVAWLHCRIDAVVDAGDHRVVIAQVGDGRIERLSDPLVYHDGAYTTVGELVGSSAIVSSDRPETTDATPPATS